MLLADSIWEISCALFVLTFFSEAVRPGLHAACLDYCEIENQKRSMGLLRLAVNLGMAIGPVIGGFLAQYALWNWLFILDGVTCFVSAVLLFLVFGWGRQHVPEPATETSNGTKIRSPWQDRRMLSFGFYYLLTLIVFVQFASTFVKYLKDIHQLSESQIGLISSINPILIVIVEMLIIKAIEKRSTLKTIAVGALLICLGFGSLPFGPSAYFCIISVTILTFGEILAFPVSAAYVAELSDQANRGRYMGFITVMFSIAMIVGPVLGLSLYEINPDLPWYASLGAGLLTFTALWNMKPSVSAQNASAKKPLSERKPKINLAEE